MSKLVKILLAILAVLVIAAGGFWSGTRFAYQQVASDPSRQAAITAPNIQSAPAAGQNDSQGLQSDKNGRQDDSRPQANAAPDETRQDSRQSGWNGQSGPGMMMGPGNRQSGNSDQNRPSMGNSGPMASGFGQNNPTGGMLPARQYNGGIGMFAGGSFMSGAFMLFGLLFPLGFGILIVLGIIILFRIVRQPSPATVAATSPCTKCGASLQIGWAFCPHCGEPIQK
jgi:hypothetical protein